MFIKKLYHFNKALFLGFIFFVAAFLYINFKWGMVATPVLEYGMFAGKFYYADTQTVYKVKADGVFINSGDISFTERDVMQIYIDHYLHRQSINQNAYATMSGYLNKMGLSSFTSPDKFIPPLADTVFSKWYHEKMEKITGKPVTTLEVYQQHFVWSNHALVPVDTLTKITGIEP